MKFIGSKKVSTLRRVFRPCRWGKSVKDDRGTIGTNDSLSTFESLKDDSKSPPKTPSTVPNTPSRNDVDHPLEGASTFSRSCFSSTRMVNHLSPATIAITRRDSFDTLTRRFEDVADIPMRTRSQKETVSPEEDDRVISTEDDISVDYSEPAISTQDHIIDYIHIRAEHKTPTSEIDQALIRNNEVDLSDQVVTTEYHFENLDALNNDDEFRRALRDEGMDQSGDQSIEVMEKESGQLTIMTELFKDRSMEKVFPGGKGEGTENMATLDRNQEEIADGDDHSSGKVTDGFQSLLTQTSRGLSTMKKVLSSCSLDHSCNGQVAKVDDFVCTDGTYKMPLKRSWISVPTGLAQDDQVSMLSNPIDLSDVYSQMSEVRTMDEDSLGVEFITNDDLILENSKNKYNRRFF